MMLPIELWYLTKTRLPANDPGSRAARRHAGLGVRRMVGLRLIALGRLIADERPRPVVVTDGR